MTEMRTSVDETLDHLISEGWLIVSVEHRPIPAPGTRPRDRRGGKGEQRQVVVTLTYD